MRKREELWGREWATSGHNVLPMRNDVSKKISRFRLPSSGRRRLLLKVPTHLPKALPCKLQPPGTRHEDFFRANIIVPRLVPINRGVI